MSEEKEREESVKIEFYDKRRIKSAEDVCDDAEEADLDRLPTAVAKIQDQLDENDKRLKEYISAHKEKMAEMDQLRKRLEEDVDKRARARFGDMLKELFPFLDDLDRAVDQVAGSNSADPLVEGVRLMRDGFFKVLTTQGLEVINCENKPFDPETAQAVATVPVEDDEKDNVVVEQLATGYAYDGRVLRPALVRVGQKV